MAVTERNSRRRILLGESNNALFNLVAINAVIFVILGFTLLIYEATTRPGVDAKNLFTQQVLNFITVPSDFSAWLHKPWTLLTFMFAHTDFSFAHTDVWMLISNLLWLGAFGYIFQDLTGNSQIIPIYIYGGIAGGLVFLTSCTLIPGMKELSLGLLGANSSIMAIAVATTMVAPDYRIFPMLNGGIPLWILTIIYVAIDVAGLGVNTPYPYHLSHLAGATMGFIFVKQLRKGNDWGAWMHRFYDWLMNLFNPGKINEKKSFKKELFYKSHGNPPFTKTPLITQQKVDELLDKISQRGYHHLTDEERDILKRASEEDL